MYPASAKKPKTVAASHCAFPVDTQHLIQKNGACPVSGQVPFSMPISQFSPRSPHLVKTESIQGKAGADPNSHGHAGFRRDASLAPLLPCSMTECPAQLEIPCAGFILQAPEPLICFGFPQVRMPDAAFVLPRCSPRYPYSEPKRRQLYRNRPVTLLPQFLISSGVPQATISPPSAPPPGPMSIT